MTARRTAEITVVFHRTIAEGEEMVAGPLFDHLASLPDGWRWWQEKGTLRVGRKIDYQLNFRRPHTTP